MKTRSGESKKTTENETQIASQKRKLETSSVVRLQVIRKTFDNLQSKQLKRSHAATVGMLVSNMLHKQLALPETEIFPSQRHVGRVKLLFHGLYASACRLRTRGRGRSTWFILSTREQLEKKNSLNIKKRQNKASPTEFNQSVFLLPRCKDRWCCCLLF